MYEVAHVGLVVKDCERSAAFYSDVLGCRETGRYRDERVNIIFIAAGAQTIELVQYAATESQPRLSGVVDHLAFKVADIDSAVARLKEKGVTLLFDEPKTVMGNKRIFFFAGPDGERLEFMQEVK